MPTLASISMASLKVRRLSCTTSVVSSERSTRHSVCSTRREKLSSCRVTSEARSVAVLASASACSASSRSKSSQRISSTR